ncbi:MAG: MTH1187 family thiamine-binding protein [Thermodesulfobacteriota bacterium]
MEFTIMPVGKGVSLSEDVAKAIRIVAESGLPHENNAMGTVVEGEWDELTALVKRCRDELIKDSERVIINMKIDDRPGKPSDRLTEKLRSIEERLGK